MAGLLNFKQPASALPIPAKSILKQTLEASNEIAHQPFSAEL